MNKSDLSNITILDGGFGRELQRRGISIDAPLWSANAFYTHPETIGEIHAAFTDAGADIISTNTYALTSYNLSKAGKQDDQKLLLDKAYDFAKQATNGSAKIAAAIPPLVESYRPDLVDEELMNTEYALLVSKALEHKADIILGETLSSQAEVLAILEQTLITDTPVWIGYTVNSDGNLRSGECLKKSSKEAVEKGASAILVNCSTPESTNKSIDLLKELSSDIPITYGAYANLFNEVRNDFTLESGLNTLRNGITVEDYIEFIKYWVDNGATIIGGCCGVGVEYIQALSSLKKA